MTKTTEEMYKHSYQKLYSFLKAKHPEVLTEYREYLEKVKRKIEDALLSSEEVKK